MISVVTPTLNSARTLSSCLASVRGQLGVEVEHLVQDGNSRDGCQEIARKGGAHIVSEPDEGLYDAMNRGIARATGGIVGLLNSDDFYANAHALSLVEQAFGDRDIDGCYGDLVYVQTLPSDVPEFRVSRYWRAGDHGPESFRWGWMPPHPTLFLRKSVYETCGDFRLDLGTAADYEFILRALVRQRARCVYIPQVLVCMRTGGASNRSVRGRLQANRMDRRAWQANGLKPYPWTTVLKPVRKMAQWVPAWGAGWRVGRRFTAWWE